MEIKFEPKSFEQKWRKMWEEKGVYSTPTLRQAQGDTEKKEKYYVLDMYPYPSGSGLHVGHPRGYLGTDVVARFKRMKGFNVLHPMGFDSFGLPAENYAIKTGTPPAETTDKAIEMFKSQIENIGLSYDWDKELSSHRPDYYKWTQWLFLKFYEKGLAYKKKAPVNWCPKDNTVLANEQVIDGKCERCDTEVVQKDMEQWFYKITDYADRLIEGLDRIDWPESTKLGQKNWIGKSEGARIKFEIKNTEERIQKNEEGSNISISTAEESDAEAISEIIALGWRENNISPENGVTIEFLEQTRGYTIPVAESRIESTRNYIKEFPEQNYVARMDGKVVAWIGLEFKENKTIGFGIYTHPDFRGKGIGTSVMNNIFEKYSDRTFEIEVSKTNEKAIELYKRLGFEITGEDKWFKEGMENKFLPLHVMTRVNVNSVEVFSTAHDTIFGATFMVIAPENKFFKDHISEIKNRSEVEEYINAAKGKTELERQQQKEKTGVKVEGLVAINPMTNKEMPIYVADYVLNGYGTGAVMGVPGHDERDFEFANKYGLEIIFVTETDEFVSYTDGIKKNMSGFKVTNSGEYDGMDYKSAREKMMTDMESKGFATREVNYRLRDWLLSRQRYWGAPIPIVYDPEGNAHPVPYEHLPVLVPTDVDFKPTGESPLVYSESFHKSAEDLYGKGYRREVDTMDTFVDSSWYFFRFTDVHNENEFASSEKMNAWMPVDLYVGGAEHTVLHLLYARFFTKVLFDMGIVNFDEPFQKLRHQGMVLAEDSRKMSKRWGNTIDPNVEIEKYGADTLRMYEMFMGPFDATMPWSTKTEIGVFRFLSKVWNLREKVSDQKSDSQEREINKLIKKVTTDIENMSFNTAVAKMMEFVNFLIKEEKIDKSVWERFVLVIAPFGPYIAEELWSQLGNEFSVHNAKWPEFNPEMIKDSVVKIAVQVNGKLRATIEMEADSEQEAVHEAAMKEDLVKKYVTSEPKKVIYVKNRILNIVV